MKVYFVRHAESENNANNRHTNTSAGLTKVGHFQAHLVAERLVKEPIDLIITSPLNRATETASIIKEHLNKEIIFSDLLAEVKIPSELLRENLSAKERRKIYEQWMTLRFSNEHTRYSDEETLADLKLRAEQALRFIAAQNIHECIVVTHENFMRALFGFILGWEKFSAPLFKKLRDSFVINNTGISVFEYEVNVPADHKTYQPGRAPGWRLKTWNDHSHLK